MDFLYSKSEEKKKNIDSNRVNNAEKCPKCNNTGIVKEKNKSVHVCWDCLNKGRLDVHSKNLPDNDIRI